MRLDCRLLCTIFIGVRIALALPNFTGDFVFEQTAAEQLSEGRDPIDEGERRFTGKLCSFLHLVLRISALIIAGEMIFSLPFHTQRLFRPTLLEAFNLSNTQLGDIIAVYGLTAMVSYLVGGPFADRYSARSLIAGSLVLTAIGGLYMATFPGVWQMSALYGYWGVTTVFFFWAAHIKATRDWGGSTSQGTAFGILDGGRGLAAAVFGGLAVGILAVYLPTESSTESTESSTESITDVARKAGLRSIILYYSMITLVAAGIVWIVIPNSAKTVRERRNPFATAF